MYAIDAVSSLGLSIHGLRTPIGQMRLSMRRLCRFSLHDCLSDKARQLRRHLRLCPLEEPILAHVVTDANARVGYQRRFREIEIEGDKNASLVRKYDDYVLARHIPVLLESFWALEELQSSCDGSTTAPANHQTFLPDDVACRLERLLVPGLHPRVDVLVAHHFGNEVVAIASVSARKSS